MGLGRSRAPRLFGFLLFGVLCGIAQTPQAPPPAPASASEVATREGAFTFKSRVNLVSVPVVVRDSRGRAVGNLPREDFQVSDNGKPQIIAKFAMEKLGQSAETLSSPAAPAPATPKVTLPDRFVAFLFDDTNMKFSELVQSREAAWRYMQKSLHANERIAIATTSGLVTRDFTSDRDALHATLLKIMPRTQITNSAVDCPPMSIYQADQLDNKHNPEALSAAISDVKQCTGIQMSNEEAKSRAENAARMILHLADRYILDVFGTLDALVRKISVMAGQRTIVMVSPGFLVLNDRRSDETAVFERAVHSNVVINALDARGLWVDIPGGDASEKVSNGETIMAKSSFAHAAAMNSSEILAETASATGGRFFENSNDLDEGFSRIAAAPEYLYVLAFNPQELKMDGKFHTLKVTLKNSRGVTVEARRGYYAPRYAADSAERTREEMEEAFFSREENGDIPVVVQTQFFKAALDKATVTVAAKVDLKALPFRKAEGRNRNDLTLIYGLFDTDGNFVTGLQKFVEMRLRDETMQARLDAGITVRSTFDVQPGTYMVRVVVRDSEGSSMASRNAIVEIP
jgi:VWFA-related protein